MMSVRLSLPLLMAVLAPSLTPTTAVDTTSPPSAVSIYVPGYQTKNWNGLAGSVISSVSLLILVVCRQVSVAYLLKVP